MEMIPITLDTSEDDPRLLYVKIDGRSLNQGNSLHHTDLIEELYQNLINYFESESDLRIYYLDPQRPDLMHEEYMKTLENLVKMHNRRVSEKDYLIRTVQSVLLTLETEREKRNMKGQSDFPETLFD